MASDYRGDCGIKFIPLAAAAAARHEPRGKRVGGERKRRERQASSRSKIRHTFVAAGSVFFSTLFSVVPINQDLELRLTDPWLLLLTWSEVFCRQIEISALAADNLSCWSTNKVVDLRELYPPDLSDLWNMSWTPFISVSFSREIFCFYW